MSQLSEEYTPHLLRLGPLVLSLLRLDNVRVFCPAHYVQGQTRSSGGHSGKSEISVRQKMSRLNIIYLES
jgi:hypothetical protein